jgi:fatty-acyl-CoA synthase
MSRRRDPARRTCTLPPMHVPLTLVDFLERAALVYGDRVAIVDEPDPPGGGLGQVTYAALAAMARSLAVALDRRGVPAGARVAIIAPNSARFLAALFGVSAYGRVLVPVNFRLNDHEIRYILEHSGATVALVDPDCADVVPPDAVAHRLILGHATDDELFGQGDAAPAHAVTDEAAPVSINYTSGTTARPKGVQLTHRSCWLNAVDLRLARRRQRPRRVPAHAADVPLPTAGACRTPPPRWACARSCCARSTAPRSCDGSSSEHGVTSCAARRPWSRRSSTPPPLGTRAVEPVPGRHGCGSWWPARRRPTRTIERVETELGWEFIQIYGLTETAPLLTVNRSRALGVGPRCRPPSAPPSCSAGPVRRRSGAPAGRRSEGEVLARSNHVPRWLLGAARGHRRRDRRRLVPHRRRRHPRRRAATSPSPIARRT